MHLNSIMKVLWSHHLRLFRSHVICLRKVVLAVMDSLGWPIRALGDTELKGTGHWETWDFVVVPPVEMA